MRVKEFQILEFILFYLHMLKIFGLPIVDHLAHYLDYASSKIVIIYQNFPKQDRRT